MAQWKELAQRQSAELKAWMLAAPEGQEYMLLCAVFAHSPYLTRLVLAYPQLLRDVSLSGFDAVYRHIILQTARLISIEDQNELVKGLRVAKNQSALLIALADIAGVWTLERVTEALSDFAEQCLAISLDHILRSAAKRGEIMLPHPQDPCRDSGIIILGMGKLGGKELNYSSDIDLIVFF